MPKFIDSFQAKVKLMMSIDRPARVIAAAAGIGMFIGLSPYIGLHTYLAFLVSSVWNLPIAPLIVGAYVTNPITIPIIYGIAAKIGLTVLGKPADINFDWGNVSLSSLFDASMHLVLPLIIGTHVLAVVFGALTFFIVFGVVKIYRD